MIDIHAHILPGLDDGPGDIKESIEMCRIAQRDGIHTIVATPHINPGLYDSPKQAILSKVAELNRNLSRSSPPDNQINLSREMRSIFHWDQIDPKTQ